MGWDLAIPKSWVIVRLDEVVSAGAPIIYGILQPGPEHEGGVPYIRPTEIQDGKILVSEVRRTSTDIAVKYRRSTLRAGDVLLSIVGSIGKVALVPSELDGANITQSSVRLRIDESLATNRWIAYALKSTTVAHQFESMVLGTGVPRLNVAHVRETEVAIAPLNEQRRIVAKLDAIFERTRAAKARLDRLPALLEKLKRSLLAAAFRGDLTKDWRAANPNVEPASVLLERIRAERRRRWEDSLRAKGKDPKKAKYEEPAPVDTSKLPELPECWAWASLGQVIDRVEAGRSPKAAGRPASSEEVGVLKVSAVSWGQFLPDENKALLPGDIPDEDSMVRKGDLLISRANTVDLVGAVVLVHDHFPNLMLSDKTLRLVPVRTVRSEFLLYALRTAEVRRLFEDDATGTSDSMRNLSHDKMRAAPVPVAPRDEQALLAKRLTLALGAIDNIVARLNAANAQLQAIERGALAKAFRGELVSQDSNDEPSALLLERVQADRRLSNPKDGAKASSRTSTAAGHVSA